MGMAAGKIASVARTFVKACKKKSILQTKPNIFHGINPTLTYPKSGEPFALPRYISKEMQEVRQMNKISIYEARAAQRADAVSFPKASAEDLQRLTANTFEASYSRCVYVRPKDGEIFNLLKTGETKDGKYIMRVLDSEGAFIKEVQVKPKVHVIIDDLSEKSFDRHNPDWRFQELYNLSHAEYMSIGARKNNPFEKVVIFNVSEPCKNGKVNDELKVLEIYRDLAKKIQNGENMDIISISRGAGGIGHDLPGRITGRDYNDIMTNESYRALVQIANQNGVRVLNSAGNGGPSKLNRNLLNSGAEGVGALGRNGKVIEYSSTRNTYWTQHYERSGFPVIFSKDGINITGTSGIDIPVKNMLIGQENNAVQARFYRLKSMMQKISDEHWKTTDKALKAELENKFNFLKGCLDKIGNWYYVLTVDSRTGKLQIPEMCFGSCGGTSLATAARAAKINLHETMKEVL